VLRYFTSKECVNRIRYKSDFGDSNTVSITPDIAFLISVKQLLLGRIAYTIGLVVCVSVCVLGTRVSAIETDEQIETPFQGRDRLP